MRWLMSRAAAGQKHHLFIIIVVASSVEHLLGGDETEGRIGEDTASQGALNGVGNPTDETLPWGWVSGLILRNGTIRAYPESWFFSGLFTMNCQCLLCKFSKKKHGLLRLHLFYIAGFSHHLMPPSPAGVLTFLFRHYGSLGVSSATVKLSFDFCLST